MLYVLPCAGGSAFNYKKLLRRHITTYEYAGHWSRFDEKLDEDFESMVDDLVSHIVNDKKVETVSLLGHSMGALIAWSACIKLKEKGIRVVNLYIVSCGTPSKTHNIFNMMCDDTDIIDFIHLVRQIPDKVVESEFFAENLLPCIRNDFKILKSATELLRDDVLEVPITCFCGEDDPIVSVNDMKQWINYTTSEFEVYSCPGDHFFITRNSCNEILKRILCL